MINTGDNTTQDMNHKSQSSGSKTEIKFYEDIGNYYNEMRYHKENGNVQFEEDTHSRNAQSVGENKHKVINLLKFS